MKQLRILAVYGKYKSHKEVTFEVPEEVANYFVETFRKRHEGEIEIPVEGSVNMKINLSILDADQKF